MQHPPEPGAPADEAARSGLRRVVDAVADRVRALPLSQLDRAPLGGDEVRATAVRRAAQELADLGADAEGRPRLPLPALALHGLGDQLAVVGHDVAEHGDAGSLRAAHDVLVGLRRAL
ncbi:hypothetical protein [Kineococcus terrestris]|uniref:hypothetical protein n=1 Tax=Kineococcus terrestris TaxID=2044856 RepID=UPI0034DAF365